MRRVAIVAMVVFIAGCSKQTNRAWIFESKKDELTDKMSYFLQFLPQDNKSDARPRLVLSCDKSEPMSIVLATAHYISNPTDLEYRVDDRPSISRRANGINKLIFVRSDQVNIVFDDLKNGKRLIMRFHSVDDIPYTVLFDISEFSAQADKLKGLCGL